MMLKPSVVMSVYQPKDRVTRRKISFRQTKMRWVALLFGVLVCFGMQYCFDNPSALEHHIEENQLHKANNERIKEDFNWLYSIYSLPNIIIPLVGGMMIDKLGARVVLVFTAGLCTLGQAIFAAGGFKNYFWLMLLGRAVFGLGGQSLTASQNTLLSNWFEPSQLSLIIGICMSFPKVGSALNSYLSPLIAHHFEEEHPQGYHNVYMALFVGLCFMAAAFLVGLLLFYMDYQSDKRQKRFHESQILSQKPEIKVTVKKRDSNKTGSFTSKKSLKSKNGQVKVEETEANLIENNEGHGDGDGGHGNISLKDILLLPISFWLLIIVSMLSEALFIPFLDNGNVYFSTIYNVDSKTAGTYLILPYLFCALLCPFLGLLIDKIKWRSLVVIFACFMFAITYGGMMFLEYQENVNPNLIAIPLALLGVCCALFCTAIVPSVPMLIDPKLFGTGFGLMEMLQNLALATFPLLASMIQNTVKDDRKLGFQRQTLFYFTISVVCLIFSIVLAIVDRIKGNKMMHKDFRKEYVKTVLEPQNDLEAPLRD